MRNTITELCTLSGISGKESTVREYIVRQLHTAKAVTDIRTDAMGNCFVSLKGKQTPPQKVVFAAHMDEVGGIVTGITAEGYLRFDVVGGINKDALFAKPVYVNGHCGVIGGKAVHQCTGDDKNTVPARSSMLIDIGVDSEEEARKIAREGDAITFSPECFAIEQDTFCVKALDDRVGCALLMKLAQAELEYDITLVFTVQEEIGVRGAATAAFALQPDIAVVVDSTTASDLLGVPKEKQVTEMGGGPVVSFMDKSTMYNPDLYRDIRDLAAQNNIPTQTKTMISGGNDSRAFQCAGVGARVTAISLPCRYIHSPASICTQQDIDNMYRLLELLANRLPTWEPNT